MNTVIDFWQMIWDINAAIIVSLYADERSEVKKNSL
jgi:protein tyrosine phosphatase